MSDSDDKRNVIHEIGDRTTEIEVASTVFGSTDSPTYLVGGAVRDLLAGREPIDLDFAVDGPLDPVIAALDGMATMHERFETATVVCRDGLLVDLARTRSESYSRPGALPEVAPAPIEVDLERRDFTINAMAVPLGSPGTLMDPFGGRSDLEMGRLRALHSNSFSDDPTRALRGARYASRFGLEPDDELNRQISLTDLTTVSPDRVEAELRLNAREESECHALSLAVDWGVLVTAAPGSALIGDLRALLEREEAWVEFVTSVGVTREQLFVAAVALPNVEEPEQFVRARALAEARPESPSQAIGLAVGATPEALVIARLLGADWLDRWCEELRSITLSIDGNDLLAAGIPPGAQIGVGLTAALNALLDGRVDGRDAELAVALEAARVKLGGG